MQDIENTRQAKQIEQARLADKFFKAVWRPENQTLFYSAIQNVGNSNWVWTLGGLNDDIKRDFDTIGGIKYTFSVNSLPPIIQAEQLPEAEKLVNSIARNVAVIAELLASGISDNDIPRLGLQDASGTSSERLSGFPGLARVYALHPEQYRVDQPPG